MAHSLSAPLAGSRRRRPPRLRLASHLVVWGLLLSSVLLVGCVDGSEPRPSPSPAAPADSPFACDAGQDLETQLLQDFEAGDSAGFFVDTAEIDTDKVSPPKSPAAPPATAIDGGRCGQSARGFRITASDLQGWGVSFGYSFDGAVRDLSSWDGVAFWARRSADSGSTAFFSVVDLPSDERASDGSCLYESEDSSERCDPYGTGIGLETRWRYFQIDFDELRQRGFGRPTDQLDTTQILRFAWTMERGNWEVWLDDLVLYRRPAEGSVGGSAGAYQ